MAANYVAMVPSGQIFDRYPPITKFYLSSVLILRDAKWCLLLCIYGNFCLNVQNTVTMANKMLECNIIRIVNWLHFAKNQVLLECFGVLTAPRLFQLSCHLPVLFWRCFHWTLDYNAQLYLCTLLGMNFHPVSMS